MVPLLIALVCSAVLQPAAGALTAGTGLSRVQRPQQQQQVPTVRQWPSRALLGFEAEDPIETAISPAIVEAPLNGTATVCDGVAGFDGNELPFLAEMGATYNLLSSPNYQLNAQFSEQTLTGSNCVVIMEAGLQYHLQQLLILPDVESDGGIVLQINGAQLRLSKAAVNLLRVEADDSAESSSSSTTSPYRYVDLLLVDEEDLTVSTTVRDGTDGSWMVVLRVCTPDFSFTFVRGPTPSGGLEVAIKVEKDPLLLDSLHGLVGQTVSWDMDSHMDGDSASAFMVSGPLADNFEYNQFIASDAAAAAAARLAGDDVFGRNGVLRNTLLRREQARDETEGKPQNAVLEPSDADADAAAVALPSEVEVEQELEEVTKQLTSALASALKQKQAQPAQERGTEKQRQQHQQQQEEQLVVATE